MAYMSFIASVAAFLLVPFVKGDDWLTYYLVLFLMPVTQREQHWWGPNDCGIYNAGSTDGLFDLLL